MENFILFIKVSLVLNFPCPSPTAPSFFFFLDDEYQWRGPFYFIQGADPQFGLMKAWAVGDTKNGDDEWGEEIKLAEQAVQAINKLNPKPKFFVLCGDLIHGMPGKELKV